MMRIKWLFLLSIPLFLTACNKSQQTHNHDQGIFNMIFVQPIDKLLHALGHL